MAKKAAAAPAQDAGQTQSGDSLNSLVNQINGAEPAQSAEATPATPPHRRRAQAFSDDVPPEWRDTGEPAKRAADKFDDPELANLYSQGMASQSLPAADEPEEDAEPAAATQQVYAPELLQYAGMYGLNKDDYSGPEALGRAILREAELRSAFGQQPAPQQQQPTQQVQQTPADFDIFDGKAEELERDLGKGAVDVMRRMNEHYKRQQKDLIEKHLTPLQRANQQLQQTLASQEEQRIDGIFSSLGDKFGNIFGSGSIASIQNSPAALARQKVFQSAISFSQLNGVPVDSRLIEQFAAMLFGATPKQAAANAAAQNTANRLQRRQGQFLAPSTSRHPGPSDPREEALETIRNIVHGKRVPNGSAV